jgi:hypothetical protein
MGASKHHFVLLLFFVSVKCGTPARDVVQLCVSGILTMD